MKLSSYVLIVLLSLSAANIMIACEPLRGRQRSYDRDDASKRRRMTMRKAAWRARKEESLSPSPSDNDRDIYRSHSFCFNVRK